MGSILRGGVGVLPGDKVNIIYIDSPCHLYWGMLDFLFIDKYHFLQMEMKFTFNRLERNTISDTGVY